MLRFSLLKKSSDLPVAGRNTHVVVVGIVSEEDILGFRLALNEEYNFHNTSIALMLITKRDADILEQIPRKQLRESMTLAFRFTTYTLSQELCTKHQRQLDQF